jgi:hypothetical protein
LLSCTQPSKLTTSSADSDLDESAPSFGEGISSLQYEQMRADYGVLPDSDPSQFDDLLSAVSSKTELSSLIETYAQSFDIPEPKYLSFPAGDLDALIEVFTYYFEREQQQREYLLALKQLQFDNGLISQTAFDHYQTFKNQKDAEAQEKLTGLQALKTQYDSLSTAALQTAIESEQTPEEIQEECSSGWYSGQFAGGLPSGGSYKDYDPDTHVFEKVCDRCQVKEITLEDTACDGKTYMVRSDLRHWDSQYIDAEGNVSLSQLYYLPEGYEVSELPENLREQVEYIGDNATPVIGLPEITFTIPINYPPGSREHTFELNPANHCEPFMVGRRTWSHKNYNLELVCTGPTPEPSGTPDAGGGGSESPTPSPSGTPNPDEEDSESQADICVSVQFKRRYSESMRSCFLTETVWNLQAGNNPADNPADSPENPPDENHGNWNLTRNTGWPYFEGTASCSIEGKILKWPRCAIVNGAIEVTEGEVTDDHTKNYTEGSGLKVPRCDPLFISTPENPIHYTQSSVVVDGRKKIRWKFHASGDEAMSSPEEPEADCINSPATFE